MRLRVWLWSVFCLSLCAVGLMALLAQGQMPEPPLYRQVPKPIQPSEAVSPPYAYIPTPQNTPPQIYKATKAVCRIRAEGWSGSGTLIATRGSKALVLSCRHVCPQVGMVVEVQWPLVNQSSMGQVVEVVDGHGFNNDLALVWCHKPKGVSPVRIKPFCGACGPWFGFGWRGDLFRLATANRAAKHEDGLITVASAWVSGMSGGPLLDSRGCIVGVVVGTIHAYKGGPVIYSVAADGPWLESMLKKYGRGNPFLTPKEK